MKVKDTSDCVGDKDEDKEEEPRVPPRITASMYGVKLGKTLSRSGGFP